MRARVVLTAILLLNLMARCGWAAPSPKDSGIFVSSEELVKMGVDLREFAPGAVSNDETMMIGHQKITDAKEIAKGHVYKLFIFKLDLASKKVTADAVFLPLPSLENYAWTADSKTVVCMGGFGTRFVAVDIATRQVRTVFAHAKGQPGFRATSMVFFLEKGRIHAPGYFYDKEQMTTSQAVAAIDPSKSGLDAFENVLDISTLFRTTLGWAMEVWYATDQAYYVLGAKNDKRLYAFTGDQKSLKLLDRAAYRVDLVAAGAGRAVACMRESRDVGRTVVFDVAANKKWTIGEPKKVYLYPYMSRDGATLLVSTIDLAGRKMTTWYAHDTDAWGLHPMPGLSDVWPGVIRFSRKGGLLAFFNKDGLAIKPIP
ncbi:MAG: hypothetical protein EB084_01880 [Proteobacteria bacterium]|nr:hypothetical protein [Pseudomonadota bacterium]